MPERNVVIRRRDYACEMRELVDTYRDRPEYNAASAAVEIYDWLIANDRELLIGFLEGGAVLSIRSVMTAADAATRAYARANGPASVFAEAANEAEKGNPGPLRQGFLDARYVVDEKYSRKELRNMTSDDVLYVAQKYQDRARGAMREAQFLREIAKQIGNRTVGAVFNNVQLAELHGIISGKM